MTTSSKFTAKYSILMLLTLGCVFAPPAWAQAPQPQSPPVTAAPDAATPDVQPSAGNPSAPTSTAARTSAAAISHSHGFVFPKLGNDIYSYMPTSSKTRNRFGSDAVGIGIGIGRPYRPSTVGRFSFDFSSQYQKTGDRHLFMAPLGVGYRRAFSVADLTRNHTFVPYFGASADLVPVDLRSPEDNVHSGFRLTAGGSFLIGTTIGASGFAEAKYLEVGDVKGFDLSGIKLGVGVRF